jgi:hypothetical protein
MLQKLIVLTEKISKNWFFEFKELLQLTGIAAILRFPMPDIEDEELSDDSDEDDTRHSNQNISKETFNANGHICTNSEQDEVTPSPQTSQAQTQLATKSKITIQDPLQTDTHSVVEEAESETAPAAAAAAALPIPQQPTTSTNVAINNNNNNTKTATGNKKNKKFTNKENYYHDEDDYLDDFNYRNGNKYDDYDDY